MAATSTIEIEMASEAASPPVSKRPATHEEADEAAAAAAAAAAGPRAAVEAHGVGEGEGEAGGGGAPPSLRAALLAPANLQLIAFMAVYNSISSFYVETQIDQFEYRFGAEAALTLSATFNLAFPLGGLLAALPTSALLRHAGTRPRVYWGVTAALASLFSLLSLLPAYAAQLAAALIFGSIRCLQWACYFQFLADERRYPPHLTGRALGYNNSVIALMGDLMPYLFTFLAATDGWGGDINGRYLRIKAALLGLLLFVSVATGISTRHARVPQPG